MLKLGELNTILKADLDPFRRDLAKGKRYLKEHGDQMKATAATAGVAIAAALGGGLVNALNVDAAKTRLAAQLGGDAKYAEDMGRIAGSIYARGFGESAQQIGDAVRAVLSSGLVSEDDSDEVIEELTVKAQSLAQVFDQDVTATARAAGQMIRNGLAKNGQEAFDLLTRGFQQSGDHAGDLLDTVSEYSTKFRDLGLDGAEALGLLQQGLKAGARDADTVADALKEFSIRAIDGSEAAADGYRALGLDAEKMTAQIAKGGEGAKAGLDVVLERLKAMKDPVAQDAAAVALFGTKAEDLGDALFALDVETAADRLGTVTGAAEKLGDTLEESSSQKLESFKRQAMAALADTMAQAIPYLEKVVGFLSEHSEVVGPLAVGLGALAVVIGVVAAALKVWAVVQAILNLALWTSPITWIVLGVLLLVAAIVLIATKTTWFQDLWSALWNGGKALVEWAINWIVGGWSWLIGLLVDGAKAWWALFSGTWRKVGRYGREIFQWVIDKAIAFNRFMTSLPGKMASKLRSMFDPLKSGFKNAINWIIGRWNRLSFTIGGGSIAGIGIPSVTLNTPNIPMLAEGGRILRDGLAVVGEAGPELVHLGQGAAVQPLTGGGSFSSGQHAERRLTGEFKVRGRDLVLVLREMAQTTSGGIVKLVDG
ncbi:phage tail tape measure protein [Micromonospora andamanensis]|uniref:Phage tail tape measure protein domain-containing protein n=1 Tax=Micromonospora andamanensis TaxID=1287068 RepID=A0ABQ4HYK0_9ACTN|nr:phage tail tape measure protein [Micromonospora andamanensis]GIJ10727.1 hypothetical protein Van01_39410 [Micromonospora andamanensis]